MAITPGELSTHISAAITHLQAGEYEDARADLLSAELVLQTLPATEHASWRGSLDRAWDMLRDLVNESSDRRPRRVLLRRGRL